MKQRVKDFVDALDYIELQHLKDTLDRGELSRIVKEKIEQKQNEPDVFCVSCASEISSGKQAFTLIFGPPDMRMKASFCAVDCLEYFINKLKGKQ